MPVINLLKDVDELKSLWTSGDVASMVLSYAQFAVVLSMVGVPLVQVGLSSLLSSLSSHSLRLPSTHLT